jgi:hypothetical protein
MNKWVMSRTKDNRKIGPSIPDWGLRKYYDNLRTRTLLRNGRTKQGKTSTWNGLMTNNNNQKIADADLGRSLSTSHLLLQSPNIVDTF